MLTPSPFGSETGTVPLRTGTGCPPSSCSLMCLQRHPTRSNPPVTAGSTVTEAVGHSLPQSSGVWDGTDHRGGGVRSSRVHSGPESVSLMGSDAVARALKGRGVADLDLWVVCCVCFQKHHSLETSSLRKRLSLQYGCAAPPHPLLHQPFTCMEQRLRGTQGVSGK